MTAKLSDEAGRVRALDRYRAIDSAPIEPFDKITALVRDLLGVPVCAVSLIDDSSQRFKSINGLDLSETPRNVAFCDHTIRGSDVMVIEDATSDARFSDNPLVTSDPHIRSYAGAPLVTPDGYHLGALCAIDSKPRFFDQGDRELLVRFSALVVEQIELASRASSDFLTGALSRRSLTEAAQAALVGSARDESEVALISFDLDRFKAINDRFGHPEGDRVLVAVADACRAMLRPGDLFGRMGGEEFAILLPKSGLAAAEACAERLRAAIAALPADRCRAVTASFGIALAGADTAIDQMFVSADAALYAAKRAGRNQCVTAAIWSAAA